jgi:hypothetical protein
VSVSSLYADIELHTPASATSFASTSNPTTAGYAHALPPPEHAYPASPMSPGHGHGYVVESEGEGEWTLTSDTHSIHLEALPYERENEHEVAARGQSLV